MLDAFIGCVIGHVLAPSCERPHNTAPRSVSFLSGPLASFRFELAYACAKSNSLLVQLAGSIAVVAIDSLVHPPDVIPL